MKLSQRPEAREMVMVPGRPKRRARALGQFDELALAGGDLGGFDFSGWDFAFDTSLFDVGSLDFTGLDSPAFADPNVSLDLPATGDALTLPEFNLPDLTLADFLKYGSQALSLWQQYEQVQNVREGGTTTTAPRTTAPTQPVTRQVTTSTGQVVTQRYNPTTGQWATIAPTATGAQAQWIPGVPNIAVLGVGALAAFFALGSYGGRRR